jgi:hypothetical protein
MCPGRSGRRCLAEGRDRPRRSARATRWRSPVGRRPVRNSGAHGDGADDDDNVAGSPQPPDRNRASSASERVRARRGATMAAGRRQASGAVSFVPTSARYQVRRRCRDRGRSSQGPPGVIGLDRGVQLLERVMQAQWTVPVGMPGGWRCRRPGDPGSSAGDDHAMVGGAAIAVPASRSCLAERVPGRRRPRDVPCLPARRPQPVATRVDQDPSNHGQRDGSRRVDHCAMPGRSRLGHPGPPWVAQDRTRRATPHHRPRDAERRSPFR